MSEEYIVVTQDRSIYYFDKKGFYNFVNEESKEEDEKVGYIFLEDFPRPNKEASLEDEDETPIAFDRHNRPFGQFCPFSQEELWPENALLVLKDQHIFVPPKKEEIKTITVYKYSEEPSTPRRRTPAPRTRRR